MCKLKFVYIGEEPGKVPRSGDGIVNGDILEVDLQYAGDFLNDPQKYELTTLTIPIKSEDEND